MYNPLPSYFKTLRKKRALTQGDMARLLGTMSASALSKYERLVRIPPARILMGVEVVFNDTIREVYPALFAEVAAAILARAKDLLAELADAGGQVAEARRSALIELISRLEERPTPETV